MFDTTPTHTVSSASAKLDGQGHAARISGDRLALKLMVLSTYGLFLAAAVYKRFMGSSFVSPGFSETRSVWREAWDTGCETIAFAFNHA